MIIAAAAVFAVMYLCGIRLYSVKSGSMGKAIPKGSLCAVSTYSSFDKISVGDIISFSAGDDVRVTHRAVSVGKDGITTKGDENDTVDPDPVTKKNYIGKTVFSVPHIGTALAKLSTAAGRIILAAAGLAMVILGVFYSRYREDRPLKENRTMKGE